MRALIQRTVSAKVEVNRKIVGKIDHGLVVFVSFEEADTEEEIQWLVGKISNMRIFSDEEGKMNLSVRQVEGKILLISQFTLHALTKKGNRPSFVRAARPERARELYHYTLHHWQNELPNSIEKGEFGADMKVSLVNDGPVTIWMDTKEKE